MAERRNASERAGATNTPLIERLAFASDEELLEVADKSGVSLDQLGAIRSAALASLLATPARSVNSRPKKM